MLLLLQAESEKDGLREQLQHLEQQLKQAQLQQQSSACPNHVLVNRGGASANRQQADEGRPQLPAATGEREQQLKQAQLQQQSSASASGPDCCCNHVLLKRGGCTADRQQGDEGRGAQLPAAKGEVEETTAVAALVAFGSELAVAATAGTATGGEVQVLEAEVARKAGSAAAVEIAGTAGTDAEGCAGVGVKGVAVLNAVAIELAESTEAEVVETPAVIAEIAAGLGAPPATAADGEGGGLIPDEQRGITQQVPAIAKAAGILVSAGQYQADDLNPTAKVLPGVCWNSSSSSGGGGGSCSGDAGSAANEATGGDGSKQVVTSAAAVTSPNRHGPLVSQALAALQGKLEQPPSVAAKGSGSLGRASCSLGGSGGSSCSSSKGRSAAAVTTSYCSQQSCSHDESSSSGSAECSSRTPGGRASAGVMKGEQQGGGGGEEVGREAVAAVKSGEGGVKGVAGGEGGVQGLAGGEGAVKGLAGGEGTGGLRRSSSIAERVLAMEQASLGYARI